ncbi:hypothetical protein BKA66DRAFT_435488, partial [Pyrenochaeta sp. MPI-SDFR-AT-0127]
LDALLEVFTLFIFYNLGDRPLSSRLIYFLAVIGINVDIGRLRTIKNYSYILARVVYYIRVLSVEKLLPSALRKENLDRDRKRFLKIRKQYLTNSAYSPISEAINILAYRKFITLTAGNSSNAY